MTPQISSVRSVASENLYSRRTQTWLGLTLGELHREFGHCGQLIATANAHWPASPLRLIAGTPGHGDTSPAEILTSNRRTSAYCGVSRDFFSRLHAVAGTIDRCSECQL